MIRKVILSVLSCILPGNFDEGIVACVAEGEEHQGSPVFVAAGNASCVPNATCVVAAFLYDHDSDSATIGNILNDEFQYYLHCKQWGLTHTTGFMEADDLSQFLSVCGKRYYIIDKDPLDEGGFNPRTGSKEHVDEAFRRAEEVLGYCYSENRTITVFLSG